MGAATLAADSYRIPTPSTPAAPTSLAAIAGTSSIALTWNAVTGATTYNVYRGTTTGGETSYATGIGSTGYTDSGATPGTTYYYKVTAVGGGGESVKSNEANATIVTPAMFTGLVGWWNAGNTVLSGGKATQITDLSGAGHHLLQASGSLQAVYNAAGLNFPAQPSLTVASSGGVYAAADNGPALADKSNYAAFTVGRMPRLNGGASNFVTVPNFWGWTNHTIYGDEDSTNGQTITLIDAGFPIVAPRTTFPDCDVAYHGVISNATNFTYYQSGAVFAIAARASGAVGTFKHFKSGNNSTFASSAEWYETFVYSPAITYAQFLTLLAGYLQPKYAGLATYTKQLTAFGDSRTYGYTNALGISTPITVGPTWQFARLREDYRVTTRSLIGGQTTDFTAHLGAGVAGLFNAAAWPTRQIAIVWLGDNDFSLNATAAATYANIKTIVGSAQSTGAKVGVCTEIVMPGGLTAPQDAVRQAFNVLVAAGAGVDFDFLVDLAAQPQLQNGANLTYFDADGQHLTQAGYGVVATTIQAALVAQGY